MDSLVAWSDSFVQSGFSYISLKGSWLAQDKNISRCATGAYPRDQPDGEYVDRYNVGGVLMACLDVVYGNVPTSPPWPVEIDLVRINEYPCSAAAVREGVQRYIGSGGTEQDFVAVQFRGCDGDTPNSDFVVGDFLLRGGTVYAFDYGYTGWVPSQSNLTAGGDPFGERYRQLCVSDCPTVSSGPTCCGPIDTSGLPTDQFLSTNPILYIQLVIVFGFTYGLVRYSRTRINREDVQDFLEGRASNAVQFGVFITTSFMLTLVSTTIAYGGAYVGNMLLTTGPIAALCIYGLYSFASLLGPQQARFAVNIKTICFGALGPLFFLVALVIDHPYWHAGAAYDPIFLDLDYLPFSAAVFLVPWSILDTYLWLRRRERLTQTDRAALGQVTAVLTVMWLVWISDYLDLEDYVARVIVIVSYGILIGLARTEDQFPLYRKGVEDVSLLSFMATSGFVAAMLDDDRYVLLAIFLLVATLATRFQSQALQNALTFYNLAFTVRLFNEFASFLVAVPLLYAFFNVVVILLSLWITTFSRALLRYYPQALRPAAE